jgi:hypothetical protein
MMDREFPSEPFSHPPPELYASTLIWLRCPRSLRSSLPVNTLHSLTTLSAPADATTLPDGL